MFKKHSFKNHSRIKYIPSRKRTYENYIQSGITRIDKTIRMVWPCLTLNVGMNNGLDELDWPRGVFSGHEIVPEHARVMTSDEEHPENDVEPHMVHGAELI